MTTEKFPVDLLDEFKGRNGYSRTSSLSFVDLSATATTTASDKRCTPSDTLDVGQRWWVIARGIVRVDCWVTLVVNVESCAFRMLVTVGLTG